MSNLTISCILAGVFVCLIFLLYCQISKWKKYHTFSFGGVLKSFYCLIVAIAILITGIFAYFTATEYWQNDRPHVVTEIDGFKLGWSKDDLLFHKGEPSESSKRKDSYIYGSIIVLLEREHVARIIYDCDSDEYSSYVKIGGVACGDSLSRIEGIYGGNSDFTPSYDQLWRTYNFPKYNVGFVLSKSRVKLISLFDPAVAPGGYVYRTEKPVKAPAAISGSLLGPLPVEDEKDKTSKNELDHCAPNLSKAERLSRLGMKGQVRQTGYNTYTVGRYQIAFSGKDVLYCR